MQLEDFMVVFRLPHSDEWTWDCTECKVSGDNAPDVGNAWYEAEQHYLTVHTDLQPWEVEVPC